MKKIILAIAFLVHASAPAFLVSTADVDNALSQALLVAEVQILSVENIPDSVVSVRRETRAKIEALVSTKPDGAWLPAIGDEISISSPGGEWAETGVLFTGYPRLNKGERYRVHLKRHTHVLFAIAGWEHGAVPLSEPARAYSRNRTDGSNGEGNGPFLFWDPNYFPIPFYISEPSFRGYGQFIAAIDASFKTWRDIPDIKVEFIPMGCTSSKRNDNDGINNIVYVTDDWPFDPSAIAITRNFYIAGTTSRAGQILDSDVLLNGVNHRFSVNNEPGSHDVQNILTHEIGHFLGLGHEVNPVDPDAAMFKVASPNEFKKRELHESDLLGIHEAYAGVGQKLSFSRPSCIVSEPSTSCGAVHGANGGPGRLWFPIVLFLILSAAARFYFRSRTAI